MKYAMRDVFDFKILHKNEELFSIDTTVSDKIIYNGSTGYNTLEIVDALFSTHIISHVMGGAFKDKELTIIGESNIRGLDNVDVKMEFRIEEATLDKYIFSNDGVNANPTTPKFIFTFPQKNKRGEPNMEIIHFVRPKPKAKDDTDEV